ncbi:hypothetical protein BJ912DRAFT_1125491 [Pholiota molesta]|nr:hypothetical protein BJ912DRAFT_1125491 [Pholiota molesta]
MLLLCAAWRQGMFLNDDNDLTCRRVGNGAPLRDNVRERRVRCCGMYANGSLDSVDTTRWLFDVAGGLVDSWQPMLIFKRACHKWKAKRLAKKEPARLAREEKERGSCWLAKAEEDTAEVADSRPSVLSITSRTEGMFRGGISELGMGLIFSSYTLCSFTQ